VKTVYVHSFETPIGKLQSATTDKGVALILLPTDAPLDPDRLTAKYFPSYEVQTDGALNRTVATQILEYLNGRRTAFDLDLDWQGTPFQLKVLRRVAKIPYGKTRTYGEIARLVGRPSAARAVGAANGSNRLPLVIPCHRVVAANGLGGYGGGLALKRRLLELEGAL
jgi:methylated-DNA-[protein]-cysteine S-methyltransferase